LFAGIGIATIAIIKMIWRDLINTTQWSLLALPKNMRIIGRIIIISIEAEKVVEACCNDLVALSSTNYFAISDIIITESFLNSF